MRLSWSDSRKSGRRGRRMEKLTTTSGHDQVVCPGGSHSQVRWGSAAPNTQKQNTEFSLKGQNKPLRCSPNQLVFLIITTQSSLWHGQATFSFPVKFWTGISLFVGWPGKINLPLPSTPPRLFTFYLQDNMPLPFGQSQHIHYPIVDFSPLPTHVFQMSFCITPHFLKRFPRPLSPLRLNS